MKNRREVIQTAALSLAGLSTWTADASSILKDFYPPVTPRSLVFPRDYGSHTDFRTEWWYLTGWLWKGDEAFGFQLTFFRSRTHHSSHNPSRLAPQQLLFAHAALARADKNVFLNASRSGRLGSTLLRAETANTDLQMEDWYLRRIQRGQEDFYEGNFSAQGFSLTFEAKASKPPILRGRGGFSQKGPQSEEASYYYSRAPLSVTAKVQLDSKPFATQGQAWLDHEWSSQLLMPGAVGWDWLGINLLDGGTLMAFQMRNNKSEPLYGHVDARDSNGVPLKRWNGLKWLPQKKWRSKSLIEYPIPMDLEVGSVLYRLVPLILAQEVDARSSTGGYYWEGAVSLMQGERLLGHGYLELTGYGEPLQM